MSFPWTLAVSSLLGVWLMFAPGVFGIPIKATAANINHMGGALIVVMAVISMGEVVRLGRYLNFLPGLQHQQRYFRHHDCGPFHPVRTDHRKVWLMG